MELPFSQRDFFSVFKDYNESVWPGQIVLVLLAVAILFFAWKPASSGRKVIPALLGFLWLWMGVIYHFIFFREVNPLATIFAAAFALQGFLFIRLIWIDRVSYSITPDLRGVVGLFLVGYALIGYPLFGYWQYHLYPSTPTFGLPCPTTIFTFGVLLWSVNLPRTTLIVPGLWSLIGFSAALTMGVWEDVGLLIAGLIAIPLVLLQRRAFPEVAV